MTQAKTIAMVVSEEMDRITATTDNDLVVVVAVTVGIISLSVVKRQMRVSSRTVKAALGTLVAAASTTSTLSFSAGLRSSGSSAHRVAVISSATSIFNKSAVSPSLKMSTSSSSTGAIDCPTISLRNGMDHPSIGFGTYKVGFIPASASSAASGQGEAVTRTAKDCVLDALQVGYRFLECAQFYGNEAQIGQAMAESGIPRKELFVCSKVWTSTIDQGPAAVRAQLEQTLKDLQTDYVDLYLIHWPVPGKHVEAYQTLIELQKEGKIKGIGVSNYAWEDYLELKEAVKDPAFLPVVNQIEINPFLYRSNTISKFQADGVVLQSYRSLKDGKAFENPTLVAIAQAKNKTVAQILGRWCFQKGFVYIPKSVKKERMVENSQVLDFELTDDEMAKLDNLTTPEALDAFVALYRKCVNRDTSKDGTMDGVKMEITKD